MRGQGAFLSAGIHLTLLIIAYIGMPEWFSKKTEPQPLVITLEQLPITGKTNVKPSDKPVTRPKKEKPQPSKTKKKAPPPSKAKAAPEKEKVPLPKKDAPKDKEKPKEKPKKKKDTKEKAKKSDDDSLDEVLKNLRKEARDGDKSDKKPKKKPTPASNATKSDAPYDPTIPLSLSERDAINSQFVQCWRIPAGSANDYTLKVSVDVNLRQDGSVIKAHLVSSQRGRYNSDTVFRAAADAAVRAVHKCSPIKGLPLNKYNSWKELTLHFDPSMQLY